MDYISRTLTYIGKALSPDLESDSNSESENNEESETETLSENDTKHNTSNPDLIDSIKSIKNNNKKKKKNKKKKNPSPTSSTSSIESLNRKSQEIKEEDFHHIESDSRKFSAEHFGNNVWDFDRHLLEKVKCLSEEPDVFMNPCAEDILKEIILLIEKKNKSESKNKHTNNNSNSNSSNNNNTSKVDFIESRSSTIKSKTKKVTPLKPIILDWSETMQEHASRILKEVPEFNELRFKIVPKFISENHFWILYFYFFMNEKTKTRNDPLYTTSFRFLSSESFLEIEKNTYFKTEKNFLEKAKCKDKDFRFNLRKGISDYLKGTVYLETSGGAQFLRENPKFHYSKLYECFGEDGFFGPDVDLTSIQYFLPNEFCWGFYYLSNEGFKAAKRIFFMITSMETDYFVQHPSHVNLICLLLHYQTEEEAMATTLNLKKMPQFQKYEIFDNSNYSPALVQLIKRYIPQLYEKIKKLHIPDDFAQDWFDRLYVSFLPFQTVVRILDLYIASGPKILFRISIGLFQFHLLDLLECNSKSEFIEMHEGFMKRAHDATLLIESSYFLLKKDSLITELFNVRNSTLPILDVASDIVDNNQLGTIWTFLLPSQRIRKPQPLFSTKKHGFNLETLTSRCGKYFPLILILKTKEHHIFGGFMSCPLEKTVGNHQTFFGTGECFLFSIFPYPKKFKWTEKNNFFCSLEPGKFLRIGGPQRGIFIDDDLDSGNSEKCDTFGNDPLNGEDHQKFKCVQLEVFTC